MLNIILAVPGLIRTVGCALVSVGPIVEVIPIPQISQWGTVITQVGTVLCMSGVARAVARSAHAKFSAK